MPFTRQSDGTDGYDKLDPAPTGDFLDWVADNFHTSATLAPTYAKKAAANTFTQPNTFSGILVSSAGLSGTTLGLSGALTGTTASLSGLITGGSLTAGAGTFSGLLSASGGISGTTLSLSGSAAVTGLRVNTGGGAGSFRLVSVGDGEAQVTSDGTTLSHLACDEFVCSSIESAAGYIDILNCQSVSSQSAPITGAVKIYRKGNKLIFASNTSGTTVYFYIDLSATSQQQVQVATSEP